MAEKRDTRRRKVRLIVQTDPGSFRAVTVDISMTGLFLLTSKPQTPGTKVRLTFNTPSGLALGAGVVRWSKRVPPALLQHSKGGMGIEFTWISEELQIYLESIVNPA